jgi:rRNA small subunit pseudouridine methyltransferase Nep1
MKKRKRDIGEARPDIVHQVSFRDEDLLTTKCLLNLLDSPLNRAGLLRVYIKTTNNILIEVNPSVRIPRTFKRFAGLMGTTFHQID